MLITEKQLIMLIDTLKDTLSFFERKNGDPFTFSHSVRVELLNEILSQQSDKLIETGN